MTDKNKSSLQSSNTLSVQMEQVHCGACKCKQLQEFETMLDRFLNIAGEFHFCRCTQCGVILLNPRPTAEYN